MILTGYYGFYFDPTYWLVIIGMLICLLASANVSATMNKFHRYRNSTGLTGAEAARRILDNEGLYYVQVECIGADNGDHYDPKSRTVRLSSRNYNGATITAVSVAAHECGHAIQHAEEYSPMTLRSTLVPIVNIGSTLGVPIILIGVLLSWNQTLINIGIWAFGLAVLFQLVTLPVEFNASSRAVAKIEQNGILDSIENKSCRKVLSAAALTYVAALASTVLQVVRLVILFGGNRRKD